MEYRPRPDSLTTVAGRQLQQATLAQQQAKDRRAFEQRMARYAAQDAEDEKARQQRLEAERRQRVDAEAEALKAQLKARFLATPGSRESDFATLWPELLRRHQIEQTMTGESVLEQTVREMRQRHVSQIG